MAAQAPAFGVSAIIATLVKLLKLQCGKGPGGGSLDGSAAVAQLGDIAGSVCEAATPLQLGVMGRAFALLGHADLALWDALTAQVHPSPSPPLCPCSLRHPRHRVGTHQPAASLHSVGACGRSRHSVRANNLACHQMVSHNDGVRR